MGVQLVDPDPPMTTSTGKTLRTRLTNLLLIHAVVALAFILPAYCWRTAARDEQQSTQHCTQWSESTARLLASVIEVTPIHERDTNMTSVATALLEAPQAESLTVFDAQGNRLFHGTGTAFAMSAGNRELADVSYAAPVSADFRIPDDSDWNPGGVIRAAARPFAAGWTSALDDPAMLASFLTAILVATLLTRRGMISTMCEPLTAFHKFLNERRLRSEAAPVFDIELHKIGSVVQTLRSQLNDANKELNSLRTRMDTHIEKETKTLNVELKRAIKGSTTDKLTGLYNRRYLEERLPQAVSAAQSARQDLSVIAVDLDNFKKLNDTKGHAAGDSVLSFVGQLIRSSLRDDDFAIRMGGDEFVIVLPDTDVEGAKASAERISKLFNQGAKTYAQGVSVSMSVGVASLAATGARDHEQLLESADNTLYKAKQAGRNCVLASV